MIALNNRDGTGLTFFFYAIVSASTANYSASTSVYPNSPLPLISTNEGLLRNCWCVHANFHLWQPVCYQFNINSSHRE